VTEPGLALGLGDPLRRLLVLRLAALDTPVGYEPGLEAATLPQVDDIVRDLRHLIAY